MTSYLSLLFSLFSTLPPPSSSSVISTRMRLAREKKEVFGEMSTPPPQPLPNHAWYREKRKGRKIPQAMFQRKTILFLSLHKQDYTFFSRFHVSTVYLFRRYPSSSPCQFQSRPSPSLLSNQSILRLSGDRKRKDEGSPLSCRLSSSSSLKRFPEKKRPKKGEKSLSELRKGFSFPILFSAKPIAASATRISTLERERERERERWWGKGAPGARSEEDPKREGGWNENYSSRFPRDRRREGPRQKKGLIPESWGPFKKALFLLQRWEGAGSVCRWESAPPRLNSHLSFLSFLLSLFLVI